jgi:hypothetical protein
MLLVATTRPGWELTADLLGELGSDLLAEEGGEVFGLNGQDGLPRKPFVEGFEDGLRAEYQISGVLGLHETPMVGLDEDVEHRTALLSIVVKDAMQLVWREAIDRVCARCQSPMCELRADLLPADPLKA